MDLLATRIVAEASKVMPRQDTSTQGAGYARKLKTSTASQVLSTLIPVFFYALGFFTLFLILRRIFPRIYQPRTFIKSLPQQARTKELPNGYFNWFGTFFKFENEVVLNAQETLDGYFFLRLLRISVVSCIVGCIITWPILLPINATGAAHLTQLNILTFANMASPNDPSSYSRYYAVVVCAYLYFIYLMYMITRESIFFINLRQAYLVSPVYADRISSRTVLFCSIPPDYLTEDALRDLFGRDLVRNVWIPLDTDKLVEKVDERHDLLSKLENAEIDLIKRANKARLKSIKKNNDVLAEDLSDPENNESGSVAARWIEPKDRPTHRLGLWGLWGKKVDTINWCREQLATVLPEAAKMQEDQRAFKGKTRRAAFVQFHNLKDAQNAFQALTHHLPLHMAPRITGVHPKEILWYNLRLRWWERVIRVSASYAIVAAVIVLWSFPIAFIQTISKFEYLAGLPGLHWLNFIKQLGRFEGIITGLIPSILYIALMSLLPVFLKLMARAGGDPTKSAVEFTIQSTYFWFWVLQGFLVTTLSSGVVQAASEVFQDPSSVVNLLAKSLPAASNFFLTYFIVQGLGVVSQVLLSLVTLILYLVLGKLLDNSPRKQFRRFVDLAKPSFGTFYPIYTTFLVIAISYSCIAPLVTGFAAIGLTLFYLAFRYQFLFVFSVLADTKGLMYARALQQIFVGLYVAEGCLIGLFAINLPDSTIVLGPLILMVILLVFTILYHYSLNSALVPLLQYLPKTLENEEERLLDEEERVLGEEEEKSEVEEWASAEEEKKPNGSATPNPELGSSKTTEAVAKKTRESDESKSNVQVNFIQKFLRPDKYANYYHLRRLVPRDHFQTNYTEKDEKEAYYHPYVIREVETIWIPKDEAGVSAQEVQHTSKVTPITDEGATLNQKGQIVWDREQLESLPIYRRQVYY